MKNYLDNYMGMREQLWFQALEGTAEKGDIFYESVKLLCVVLFGKRGRELIQSLLFSPAPAEKVREDGNLLPQGELAAAGLAETVLVSHGDRMSL